MSYTIRTLGCFDIIRNKKSLVESLPGSKKIWELYKFMLTHRKQAFTSDSLMDQLWITEEYADPRSTLRKQMHRLRVALDEQHLPEEERTIQFVNGYYRWNDSIGISLDVEDFIAMVQRGDELLLRDQETAKTVFCMALEKYQGEYLPECTDQHWVNPIRNQLKALYAKAVFSLTDMLKEAGDYHEIIRISHRAAQLDIYEERFHHIMLDALLNMGDTRHALQHYEYITRFYYNKIGVKPSAEMRLLYKRMLKSRTSDTCDCLTEALNADSAVENAYYCDFDVFKSIYELERRRGLRQGTGFSIGVISLDESNVISQSGMQLQLNHLKAHLMSGLRQGDTLSRWKENQFVVLLPGVCGLMAEMILNRIVSTSGIHTLLKIEQVLHVINENHDDHIQEALRS